MNAFSALLARELVRFARQPSRIVATLATPALLWLFLAGGFARSLPTGASNGSGYASYLLPGMASAVVLFSSIFAAMTLIEDRRAGFLQAALVSPAPRWAIALAKSLGGAAIGVAQGALVLLAAPFVGQQASAAGFALALLGLAVMSVALTSLGLAAAWWVNSPEGFHGVMNLVLMPLWLLSGAFFPVEGAAGWMRAVMLANPLRWSTETVRAALAPGHAPPPVLAWGASLAFAAAMLGLAMATLARRGSPDRT